MPALRRAKLATPRVAESRLDSALPPRAVLHYRLYIGSGGWVSTPREAGDEIAHSRLRQAPRCSRGPRGHHRTRRSGDRRLSSGRAAPVSSDGRHNTKHKLSLHSSVSSATLASSNAGCALRARRPGGLLRELRRLALQVLKCSPIIEGVLSASSAGSSSRCVSVMPLAGPAMSPGTFESNFVR